MLEIWMNDWRLTLAPKKCSQITFSRAGGTEKTEELKVSLYGIPIPSEKNPKFLGLVLDRRLNFDGHYQAINKKIIERINILKILSFDPNWRLSPPILVRIYKSLIRSVMDYASVISIACNKEVVKALEIIQNDSLRVIFKKTIMDHVQIEDLREWAGVESIKDRHQSLLTSYYERALISANPLMKLMFEKYKKFKSRNDLNPNLAVSEDGRVDLEKLNFIRNFNKTQLSKKEKHPTTLCGSNVIIKNFVLDDYAVGLNGVT
jgi:hypothetical protein